MFMIIKLFKNVFYVKVRNAKLEDIIMNMF